MNSLSGSDEGQQGFGGIRSLPEQEAPVEPAATGSDLIAVELAFWDAVKDSAKEMHGAYLKRYPDGAFAALAKVRLAELRGSSL